MSIIQWTTQSAIKKKKKLYRIIRYLGGSRLFRFGLRWNRFKSLKSSIRTTFPYRQSRIIQKIQSFLPPETTKTKLLSNQNKNKTLTLISEINKLTGLIQLVLEGDETLLFPSPHESVFEVLQASFVRLHASVLLSRRFLCSVSCLCAILSCSKISYPWLLTKKMNRSWSLEDDWSTKWIGNQKTDRMKSLWLIRKGFCGSCVYLKKVLLTKHYYCWCTRGKKKISKTWTLIRNNFYINRLVF